MAGEAVVKERYLLVRVRSVLACFLHWILFFSVVILTITGLYIGHPKFLFGQGEAWQAFAMADIRYYHFIAAWGLIVGALGRLYLAFTISCNKDIKQFFPTPRNVVGAVKLAYFYITLRGKHEHYRFVNPLGGIGIFTMSLLFLVQIFTGAAMYLEGANPDTWWWAYWIRNLMEGMLGGNQGVRLVHHVAMYCLAVVVMIHVYMQIWKASMFTESDITSVVSGYKIFPERLFGKFGDIYGVGADKAAPENKANS